MAQADQGQRADCGSQFTHCHRRRPDHPGGGGYPAAERGGWNPADADARDKLRLHLRRRRRQGAGTRSSTSRSSATGPCTRTAGSPARGSTGSPGDSIRLRSQRFAPGSGWDPDKDRWELYNLDEDFSEANDLAAKHPEKLAELKKLFWEDAEKYHVTPLTGRVRHLLRHPAARRRIGRSSRSTPAPRTFPPG